MKKRIVRIMLAICLLLPLLTANAAASAEPGDSGEGLSWSYDESTSTLTISGTGVIPEPSKIGDSYSTYVDKAQKVIIEDGVTGIGDSAFSSWRNLSSVEIQGDINGIGKEAFEFCKQLSSITFDGKVGNIGDDAFAFCEKLTSISFIDTVGDIGDVAFAYCDQLTSISFANTVGDIGESAFADCDQLTSISFASTVGNIGDLAFAYCDQLTSISFAGTVGDIGKEAFWTCEQLSSITFGGNIGNIGQDAFHGCSALSNLECEGTVGNIGNSAFMDCTGLTSFPFTVSVGVIEEYAFSGCTGFHRIIFPVVDSIKGDAFSWCENLTAVYIPASVKTISAGAFDDSLKDIYFGGTDERWKEVSSLRQSDGFPVFHYGSEPELPETKAGNKETLQALITAGIGMGLTEIELTGNIDIEDKTLYVHNKSNILLDLKGYNITSTADPVFEIAGSLTVVDSTADSKPTVDENNQGVTYTSGKISGGGTAIDVLYGGSFTLGGGSVQSNSTSAPAIQLSGAKTLDENRDNIESIVRIEGGYVHATGDAAIKASGDQAYVTIEDGVLHSGGEAVILLPETSYSDDLPVSIYVQFNGGALLNTNSVFSCGIYLEGTGSYNNASIYGGTIIVKNGVGILVRKGSLDIRRQPEISAGGSGTGKIGSSDRDLEAGSSVVLDQCKIDDKSYSSIYYYLSNNLSKNLQPVTYRADDTQELKIDETDYSTRYSFGSITYYNITFDSNGGSKLTISSSKTDSDGRIVELPDDPERAGYVFRGWSRSSDSIVGTIALGDKLYRDTTLYAVWTPVGHYLITFETYRAYPYIYRLTGSNGVLTDWPDPGDLFLANWYPSRDGNEEAYPTDYKFTEDTTVYARVRPNAEPPYTITFDFGNGNASIEKKTDDYGKLENWPDDPQREGYIFKGWSRWQYSSSTVSEDYTFRGDETLWAQWAVADGYEVSFYLDEGGAVYERLRTNTSLRATLGRWPRTPLADDRFFVGWYDEPSDGSRMAVDHWFYRDTDAYAHWIPKNGIEATGRCVITFDYNGADGSDILVTDENKHLMFLPYNDPVREGYTFGGWFTDSGELVTTNMTFSSDSTVYARWVPTTPGQETYKLTVTNGTGGGDYTAGATVTITAGTAPEGKTFDKWTSDNGVTFADASSPTTTFTMPGNDVTVTATYKDKDADTPEQEKYILTVTNGTGGGEYAAGAVVNISAGTAPEGKTFDKWTSDNGGTFADETNPNTSFTMPGNDVTVTATYKDEDADTPEQEKYTLTVTNGTGGGNYAAGATVNISAGTAPAGKTFDKWTTSNGGTFADASSANTSFTMPGNDVTVTATYKDTAAPEQKTYTLTVTNGTGGGNYAAGAAVNISANTAPAGKTFDKWTTSSGGTFANASSASTTFTMPENDVTVTAAYKDAAAPERTAYVIYFDPNGGTVGVTSMMTTTDGKLPYLPIPACNGYIFDGWYTASIGGSYIFPDAVFVRDTVVYAHWIAESSIPSSQYSSPNEYAILVPSMTGGTVTVNRDYAAEGASVSVTVIPDAGYTASWLVARDSRWNELELTDKGGGKYTFTMPSKAVTVSATFTPAAVPQQADYTARPYRVRSYPGFTDVAAGAWYYDAVRYVYETGLMNGNNGAEFSPNTNISRAHLAKILHNMAGSPAVGGVSGLTDVKSGDWYADAAAWAVSRDIITSYDGGTFGPNELVTREEIAVMLWRYAGKPSSERGLYFSDAADVSAYAMTAVRWAVDKGILSGDSRGALAPKGYATRAQLAQMLMNYLG